MNFRRIAAVTLTGALALAFGSPRPAAADGAASTRNILFGAAAVGGTLLILNHNKKVHQKYAEYDQRQAQTQAEANQAEAAYQSERRAYAHEAALVSDYEKEAAYQHRQVVAKDREIASLEHSLVVAKAAAARAGRSTTFAQRAVVRTAGRAAQPALAVASPELVSYGWGTY